MDGVSSGASKSPSRKRLSWSGLEEAGCFILFYFIFLLCSHTQLINNTEDNGTETRTNVTTTEKGLHRGAAVMVGH